MMTTNFTHILNDNLDMIPGYDYPANMVEMADGSLITEEELWDSHWDEEDSEEEEATCFIDGKPVSEYEFLSHIRQTLIRLAEEKGEDSEEFREEYSFYSDVYKDINGIRPHGYRYFLE